MRLKKGSALVDYVVPTAVVGVVVGLALYAMFESGAITKYFAASSNLKIDSSGNAVLASPSTGTSGFDQALISASSPSSPNSQCANGNCAINFGDYTLTGIPENLDVATEVTGSHGADNTDIYANILQQLGEELANSDPKTAAILSNLSKTTSSIADREKVISLYKNKDIKKKILGVLTVSDKMGDIKDELASFGINGINQFGNYWSGTSNEDIYNPSFLNNAAGDIYSSDFKDQVLDNNGDVTAYLNQNPTQLAPTMYGLWQDLLESNASPEVKRMASLALSEVSNIASGINLNIEEDKKFLGIIKDYTLRTALTTDGVTVTDVNAAMLCAASGKPDCMPE